MKRLLPLLWCAALTGCGDEGPPDIVRLRIEPAATLVVGVGVSFQFRALAFDAAGVPGSSSSAVWRVLEPSVASVTGSGSITGLAAGRARVVADMAGVADTAVFEVWVAPSVADYEAGVSYFGREEYVEYIPGTLPLVLSAPHGGALTPDEIPNRTFGVLGTDLYTEETIRAVRDAFLERTGAAPHVVISHLKRSKLDPNREIGEAAQSSPFAENAWGEYHGFIEIASSQVESEWGRGLYLDLHGHGHEVQRVELGYLLSTAELNQSDSTLDAASYALKSSIAAIAQASSLPFSGLLRGQSSFGAYLAEQGVRSVPSPTDASPGGDAYFSGGYDTARHGSRDGGMVSGIQLELQRPGLRDTDENRRAFAGSLAWAVEHFMLEHYGFFRPE